MRKGHASDVHKFNVKIWASCFHLYVQNSLSRVHFVGLNSALCCNFHHFHRFCARNHLYDDTTDEVKFSRNFVLQQVRLAGS